MGMYMEQLEDMLCEELDKIAKQGELTAGSLDTIQKLTHSLKSIKTIEAMEGDGYSRDYGNEGYSYAGRNNGRSGGYSYRRDSRGRYSRRGYSRGGDKEHLIDQLEEAMHMATTERDRSVIKNCIEQMGSE